MGFYTRQVADCAGNKVASSYQRGDFQNPLVGNTGGARELTGCQKRGGVWLACGAVVGSKIPASIEAGAAVVGWHCPLGSDQWGWM